MTGKGTAGFLLLAGAFALATWLGWWAVPLVGLLWGGLGPRVGAPARWSAGAAALAWGGWLVVDRAVGGAGFGALLDRLGGLLHLPSALLPVLTVLFAVLLAGSAAVVGLGLSPLQAPAAGRTPAPPSAAGTRSGR